MSELKQRKDGKKTNAMSDENHERRIHERLLKLSEVKGDCIVFTGYKTQYGYGRLRYKGKKYIVSRLVWMLVNGEIPDGLRVCHKCDNPACINIEHLFLGTDKDNVHDAISKGRVNPVERAKDRWVKCPTIRKN